MSVSKLGMYHNKLEDISIGGVSRFTTYLQSQEHYNHKDKTSDILAISDNVYDFRRNTIQKTKKVMKRFKAKGGQKPKYSVRSLMFSVPPKYLVNNDQMEEIATKFFNEVKSIYKDKNIEVGNDDFFGNIHIQTKGNHHFNLLLPRYDKNSKSIKYTSQKQTYYQMGRLWTSIVDKVLNTNVKEYESKLEEEIKEQKKELTKIETEITTKQQEKDKLDQSIEETKKELYKAKIELKKTHNQLFDNKRMIESLTEIIEIDFSIEDKIEMIELLAPETKESETLKNYYIKLYRGILKDNQKQIDNNLKRIDSLMNKKFNDMYQMKLEMTMNKLSYSQFIEDNKRSNTNISNNNNTMN